MGSHPQSISITVYTTQVVNVYMLTLIAVSANCISIKQYSILSKTTFCLAQTMPGSVVNTDKMVDTLVFYLFYSLSDPIKMLMKTVETAAMSCLYCCDKLF